MGEDTQYCSNCQKDVANFTMHEAHCLRNIVVCAMCGESVPKTQYQIHVQDNHKELPCGKCGMMVPASDVFTHEKEQCPKRLVTCPYCELEVIATEAAAHDEACGARTDRCKGCTKFVMSKHKQFHYENDHKYLTPEEKEAAENASDEEGPECPICLGPITHPLSLECGHVFCMICVKGIANNNKNCAICRRDIPRDMLMDIRFCREEDIIKNYVNKPKDNKKVSRSHSVPSRRNSDLTIPTARQRLTRTTEDYDRMVSSLISSRSSIPTTRYDRPSNTHTPATYTPYTASSTTTSSTSCADAFKDDDCCCPSTSSSSSAVSSSSTSPTTPTTSTPAYSNRSTTSSEPSCQPSSPTSSAPAPVIPPRAHHVSRFLSSGPTTTPSSTYTRSSTPSRTSTSTSSSATTAAASRTTTMLGEPTTSSGTSSTSRYSAPSSTKDSNSSSPKYSRYSSRNSDDSYTSSTLYSSTSNTATSMTPSTSSSTRTSTETSSSRPRRPTTLDLNSGYRENSEDIARNPPENATQEEYDRWLAFQLAQSSDDISVLEFNRKHERNESRPAFRRSISMPDRPDDDTSSSDSDSDTNGRSNRRPPTSPRSAVSASSNNASRSSSISKSSSDSNASTSSQSSGTGARPKSSNLKKRVSFKEDEPPVRRVAPVLLPCEFCDEMFPERDLMRHQTSCDHNETSLPRLSRFSNVRSASIDALSPLPGSSGSRAGTPTSRSATPTSRSTTPTSRSGSDSSIPDTPNSVSPSRNVTSPTQALPSRSITSPTQTSSRSSSSPTAARSVTSPTPATETRSITSPTPLSPTESSKPPRPPAPPTKTEVKPPTPSIPPRNQVPAALRKSPLPPPPSTPPVLPTTIVTVKDATPNSSRPSSTSPALNSSSSGSTISSLASGASSCTTPSTSSSTSPTPVDTPTEDEEESPFSKPRRGRLLSSAIFSWRNMGGPRSASEARNRYARSNTAPMEETVIDHDKPGILTSHSATQLPVQNESPVPVDTLKSDIIDQDCNDPLFIKNPNKYRAPAPPPLIDYSQSCPVTPLPVTPLPHISPVLPRKEFSEFTEDCSSPVNSLTGEYSPKAMRKSFNERLKQNFRRMDSKPMMKNERSKKKEDMNRKVEVEDKSREEEITCEFCRQIFSPENFRCHKAMCEKIHESDPLQTPTPTPENIDQTSRSERESKSKSPMPNRHSKGPAPQPPTEFERKTNEDNARRRFDRAKSLFSDKSVGSFSEGVTRGRNIERRSSIKERSSNYWDSKDTDRPWGSREVLNSNNFESSPSLASSSTKYGGSVQNLSSYQPSNYPSGHGWSTHVSMVRDDARARTALNNSSNYHDNGGDDDSTNNKTYNNGEVDYDSRDRCRSRSQSVNRFNSNNNHSGQSLFHEMRSALCKTSLGHLTNESNGMRYRDRSCSRQRPNSMFASSRFGSNPHLSMYDSLSSPSRSNFSITDAFSNASTNYKSRYNR